MQIIVNGETHTVSAGITLKAFVATLPGDPRGIAIEKNLTIVPKSAHEETVLKDGDRLEVVHFVGGG